MVTTTLLHCRQGASGSLLAGLIPLAVLTRTEEGNVRFDVFQVLGAPDRLVVFERWRDHASRDRHWAEPQGQGILRLLREYLAAPLEIGRDVLHLEDVVG